MTRISLHHLTNSLARLDTGFRPYLHIDANVRDWHEEPLHPTEYERGLWKLRLASQVLTKRDDLYAFERGLKKVNSELRALINQEQRQSSVFFESSLRRLATTIDSLKDKGHWKESSFNLFEVLGFPHRRLEQIHSNILAWLMDPNGAHGLGVRFLGQFVSRFFGIRITKRESIKVTREVREGRDRPDIVIEGKNWLLLIENKVDSLEGPNQSRRYYEKWSRKRRKGRELCFAWLTPGGWQPECPHFRSISYSQITDLLQDIKLKGDASLFVRHFITHISQDLGGT